MKGAKDIAWRPTKMTEETVKKLLDAFSYSFTDAEACLYANISKPTLYEYIKRNPDFSDQKEALKKKPTIKAKMNKVKAINGWDINESWWWLERKSKAEFSTKQEIDQTTKTINFNKDVSELSDEELDNLLAN